jgi:uncharacterized membrane protein
MTVPAALTDGLIKDLVRFDGVIGLKLQRGGSVQPPGDVVTLEILNRTLPAVSRLLAERGVGESHGSITTSQPLSVVSLPLAEPIAQDSSEATWEEMDLIMGKESSMTLAGLVIMAVSGAVATVGLSQNVLHLVVGAMIIAPGFMPIVRAVLGAVVRNRSFKIGVLQLLQGYAALIFGSVAAVVLLTVVGEDPRGGDASYLPSGVLIAYWSSISPSSLLVSLFAGLAGVILVTVNRSLLTAGVMVALALVPSASLVGIGLATGDIGLAAEGALRWISDVALVALTAAAILYWKLRVVHRRRMS